MLGAHAEVLARRPLPVPRIECSASPPVCSMTALHRRCRTLSCHLAPLGPCTQLSPALGPRTKDQIAIVDLQSTAEDDAMIAAKLSQAFERTGFAVVVGVAPSIIEASGSLEAAARQFFSQPQAAKFKVRVDEAHMQAPDGYPGYLEPGHSSVANLLGDFLRPPDAVELLTYKDLHYYEAATSACHDDGIDEKPAELAPTVGEIGGYPSETFRQSAVSHFWGVYSLWLQLRSLSELALELPPGYFEDYFGCAMGTSLQIRNYPRLESLHSSTESGQMGFGAHNDSGFLTIVHTQTPGLQVDPSGQEDWVNVPVVPGGYVVNVGRLLARWTNDRWLSAIHRVIPPDMALDGPTKVTCAFFSSPAPDAMIECLPSCLDDQTLGGSYCIGKGNDSVVSGAKYPPINAGEFLRERSELHAPGAQASGKHLIEDPRKKQLEQ